MQEIELYREMLFRVVRDQTKERERLEREVERLTIALDQKQQKIDYYEGTYFTIEAAARERLKIIEQQQAQIEKYRRESVLRPLRGLKRLFAKR